MRLPTLFALLLVTLLSTSYCTLAAQDGASESATTVTASQSWARATRPNGTVGAAYMTLTNPSDEDDALTSAHSAVAGRIELHVHILDGEVMRMEEVETIPVPAQGRTLLKPGSYHLMLYELEGPLQSGESFTVELQFASGTTHTSTVIVGGPTAASYEEAQDAQSAADE